MDIVFVINAALELDSFRIGDRKEVIMSFYGAINNKKGRDVMTLDDAIRHCYNVAKSCSMVGKEECGQDHLQLAEWLEDYKRLRRVMDCPSGGYCE